MTCRKCSRSIVRVELSPGFVVWSHSANPTFAHHYALPTSRSGDQQSPARVVADPRIEVPDRRDSSVGRAPLSRIGTAEVAGSTPALGTGTSTVSLSRAAADSSSRATAPGLTEDIRPQRGERDMTRHGGANLSERTAVSLRSLPRSAPSGAVDVAVPSLATPAPLGAQRARAARGG